MSTSSNSNDHTRDRTRDRVGEPAERPSSTSADQTKRSTPAVSADAAKAEAPVAGASAKKPAEAPAREDLDPVSFQRNAVAARLPKEVRDQVADRLK